MSRHRGRRLVSDLVRQRLVVAVTGATTVGMFVVSYTSRGDDPTAARLWLGLAVLTLGATVMAGSLSIGPRPLKSLGAGCWLLVIAAGAALVWTARDAIDTTSRGGLVLAPMMLLLAMGATPLALWMIIWRPEQNWEKELRLERERTDRDDSRE